MSITGNGRRGFIGWDKRKRTLFNLHCSVKPSTINQTAKVVWGDWFWAIPSAVVIPNSGRNLTFRYNESASKLVGETITLHFNFSDQSPFGEVLSSPVCTAVVLSGSDDAPEDIIFGAGVVEDTYVSQQVTLGLPGVIYAVICTVQGEGGHVYQVMTRLAVLNNEGSFGYGRGLSIEGTLPNTYAYSTYYETLDIINGYIPFGPVTVFSGNYPIGFTPSIVDRFIVTSGIANDTGTFTFVYKLLDFAGNIAYSSQQIYIPPVDIYGSIPAIGQVGVEYSGQYQCQYGMPPYAFSIFSGTSIPGVALSSTTCIFSGPPTTAGTYTFNTGVIDDIAETDEITATVEIFALAAPFITTGFNSYYGTILAPVAGTGLTYTDIEYLPSWAVGGYVATNNGSPNGAVIFRPVVSTGLFAQCTVAGGSFLGDCNCISKEGDWAISCVVQGSTSFDLYVYQRTGVTEFTQHSGPYTIAVSVQNLYNMRLSPDNSCLVLAANTAALAGYLLLVDFNSTTGVLATGTSRTIGLTPVGAPFAVFSPDSTKVASVYGDASPFPGTVFVHSVATSALLGSAGAASGNRHALAWHPSGRFLYVSSTWSGGAYGILTYAVSSVGALTFDNNLGAAGLTSTLDISYDGNYLAAHAYDTGNVTVYTVDSTTGALSLVMDEGGGNRWACWVQYS